MKIKSLVFLIVILLSCNSRYSNDRSINRHIRNIENQIIKDSIQGEDFNSFYQQFTKDTIFQRNRIILPFERNKSKVLPNGSSSDSIYNIERKEDWIHCSFRLDDKMDYPIKRIITKLDTSFVIVEESDSYYSKRIKGDFIRKNGNWYIESLNVSIGMK